MTFEQWMSENHAGIHVGTPAYDLARQTWDEALGQAMLGIKQYGDQYRNSSMKVGMAADSCYNVCDRLRTK